MTHTLYHKCLRVSATVVASLLFVVSGFVSQTAEWGEYASRSVAQVVGVGASVAPNELNMLTAELTRKTEELNAREREIDARAKDTSAIDFALRDYILSAILFLLLSLIVLNYVLDYVRAHRTPALYEPST